MTTNEFLSFAVCLLTLLGIIDCRMRLAGLERVLLRRLIEEELGHLNDNHEQPVDHCHSAGNLYADLAAGDSG